MAVKTILKMGDPRLLRIARPVTEFDAGLQDLLQDMLDTMRAADGAGLAAPQIGVDLRVVIFGSGQPNPRYPEAPVIERTVLVNPEVEVLDRTQESGWEGCLSVPGLRGSVPRYLRVRYRAQDAQGAWFEREAQGFHARVVQHECDHLDGVLYPARMQDMRQWGFTDALPEGLSGQDQLTGR
ncbi:peptide deformylase [Hydrogenophaga sp. 5NK40-0174]|uniref:peptide deformylase n=1 Tax=Hydrogenophaga sp. 5NK40-0174 TaxID=3127649 RepID=UPI00310BED2A